MGCLNNQGGKHPLYVLWKRQRTAILTKKACDRSELVTASRGTVLALVGSKDKIAVNRRWGYLIKEVPALVVAQTHGLGWVGWA